MVKTLTEWIVLLMTSMGYPGLALIMFLENVFPPIPSEIILPLAGSLTIQGHFQLAGVTLVGAAGSVAGSWVFYALGRWVDESRLRRLLQRYGKWLLLTEGDLDRSIAWFRRYGDWAVLFGRMIPVVRSLISIPAGLAKMHWIKFTLLTALGTLGWSLILALSGRLLGHGWEMVSEVVGRFQDIVVIAIAALLLAFVIRRLLAQRQKDGDHS